jgi:hypothetical protein
VSTELPNFQRFQADLEKFSALIDVEIGTVVRKVAIDLHDNIVRRTPVDQGRARNSWAMTLDSPAPATGDDLDPGPIYNGDADGQQAKATQGVLQSLQDNPYRVVWITSNLIYIVRLENGHSQQAPAGMFAVSVAEAELEIEREIARRSGP